METLRIAVSIACNRALSSTGPTPDVSTFRGRAL